MGAGFTCRFERDRHIALRIKAADISHISVIVRRRIHVVVLGPADTLQMDRHRSSSRTGHRLYAHNARLDRKVSASERLLPLAEFDPMFPAQILWNHKAELNLSILSHFHFRDQFFLWLESVPAYPVPHIRLPKEIQC